MNPAVIIKEVVVKTSRKRSRFKRSLQLTIPTILSDFQWPEANFEKLIERFIGYVSDISHPGRRVQIAVSEMKKKTDLEEFFSISPAYWLHLSVRGQSETGFECGAKKILEDLGYRCSEWIGVEDSDSQLGAFHLQTQDRPALVLFVQNRGARRNCDLLIPITQAVP